MKILEIMTIDQLRALRSAGFVVVHSEPPPSMWKAGASARDMPGGWHIDQGGCWHRMIAESIRLQNSEATGPATLVATPAMVVEAFMDGCAACGVMDSTAAGMLANSEWAKFKTS